MTPVSRQPINDRIPWSYKAVIATLRPVLMGVTRRNWSGAEHIPRTGGFIVASNHYSEVDPLMLAHFLVDQGRPAFFLAKSSLFEVPVLGAALRHLEQVPVYRATSRAQDALVAAREALAEGKPIAIMPEGTLTRDPDLWPMKARPGVGRLALTSRAPVVPIGQWGAQEVLGRYARTPGNLLRRPVQHVKAGPPVDLSDLYDRADEPRAHVEATARIMRAVTELVGELRGETPPAVPYELGPGEMDRRPKRKKSRS
ncbi:lysophospholipid acyltransferase family protein [Ornithinimicrobium humiphilum]|uniref:1-acyl-sn-glycerol-3-phosphate acyltransferase n=1 Tax=Ornithinimicrobium humiphilum TaxID=125288 RepID=A0A543KQF4_9MICO|nr:lysophospholipid acyltransferase family protein [Ornithinimicrobium humiphilum]TQM97288.1 1-acyl-sn-glycerol-3-phosphate acyltransferase [Ornithinimicrobium humiphilum]